MGHDFLFAFDLKGCFCSCHADHGELGGPRGQRCSGGTRAGGAAQVGCSHLFQPLVHVLAQRCEDAMRACWRPPAQCAVVTIET